MCLSGLTGVPNEIGVEVAEACSKKLGKKVTFVGAPVLDEEEDEESESEQIDGDDDE